MSKNEFQESQLSGVMDAIKRGDGLAASAIFQEVGTCAWPSLVKSASEQLTKDQYVVGFELTSTMPISTPHKDYFTYSQQLRVKRVIGHTTLPLVDLSGPICKK